MAAKPLKIYIHALDGTGHINAAVGLGQAAMKRGHKVSYLLNEAFKGQVSLFGIEEILLVDKPKPKPQESDFSKTENAPLENPIKKAAQQLLKSGMFSGASSLDKLKFMQNSEVMVDMFNKAVVFDPQIEKALKEGKPDLIILDHMALPVSIQKSGIPFVVIFSGNPLMIFNNDKLPPPASGYSSLADPETWTEFSEEYQKTFPPMLKDFQARLNKEFNFEPESSPDSGKMAFPQSKYLNLYAYPRELDYQDIVPLPSNYCQIDAFCRVMPEPFKIPEELNVKPGDKLIYVSMGSMGSIDVELSKRFASILAKTPHKIIFSKGPLADEFELPPNAWGEAYVPQTSLLPHVDLVITHGGNNTVTETFSFGKPMIVHPFGGDQYDNAQRIHEKGYGIQLKPYDFTDEELLRAVDQLLNDTQLHERLKAAAKRIEESNSKDKAIERMEKLVEQHKSGAL